MRYSDKRHGDCRWSAHQKTPPLSTLLPCQSGPQRRIHHLDLGSTQKDRQQRGRRSCQRPHQGVDRYRISHPRCTGVQGGSITWEITHFFIETTRQDFEGLAERGLLLRQKQIPELKASHELHPANRNRPKLRPQTRARPSGSHPRQHLRLKRPHSQIGKYLQRELSCR